jgi:hypothetical protein
VTDSHDSHGPDHPMRRIAGLVGKAARKQVRQEGTPWILAICAAGLDLDSQRQRELLAAMVEIGWLDEDALADPPEQVLTALFFSDPPEALL